VKVALTIELTPEEEARLQEEAQRAGVDPTDYAHRLIAEDLAVLPQNPSGAQIVEYLKKTGALGVYADRDPEIARQLRARVWHESDEPNTEAAGAPAAEMYSGGGPTSVDLGPGFTTIEAVPMPAVEHGRKGGQSHK
jgi:hypothetical protein